MFVLLLAKLKSIRVVFFLFVFVTSNGVSQIKKENIKVGIAYGKGAQDKFPFDSKEYFHEATFYKLQLNYTLSRKRKWAYEVNIEPGFNIIEHQLLNKSFIQPSYGEDYLEKRELFTQKREIKEYVLNLGFIARYFIFKDVSLYALANIGPMISDKETERLAKGFAFSDVFGLGVSYDINNTQLGVRYSVRHTSNAETQQPNGGHNTTNLEFSIMFNPFKN